MIDLINRLRDQRESLKLKRFQDGGGLAGTNEPQGALTFNNLKQGANSQSFDWSNPVPSMADKNAEIAKQGVAQGLKSDPNAAYLSTLTTDKPEAKSVMENKPTQDRTSLLTSLLASQGTSSLEGSLFGLGRALGTKAGTPGKGMAVAGYAGNALLGGARSLMLGLSGAKAASMNAEWNREALSRPQNVYNNATQFQNANTTGGTAQGRYGGILSYEEGGNATFNESEEGDKTLEYKKIAQQLSEQYPTIEELDEYLQSEGVPEEDHQGILEQAQQIYGGEMQPEQEDMDEEEPMDQEEGEQQSFREGGETEESDVPFNKKVGDEIHFQYGGKTHKGTISKIENGKIYL